MAAISRRHSSRKVSDMGLGLAHELSMKEELRKLLPSMRPSSIDAADYAPSQNWQPSGSHMNLGLSRSSSLPQHSGSSSLPSLKGATVEAVTSFSSQKPSTLKSLALPNKSSEVQAPKATSTTNFLDGKSVSMHSLLKAAQRNVDLDDLPAKGDRHSLLPRREENLVYATKAETKPKTKSKQLYSASAENQTNLGPAPLKEKISKERTWSTREESSKLSSELVRLGKPLKNTNWANPEIENAFLRREVTRELLQSLTESTKPSITEIIDDSVSTRAPSSAQHSSRNFLQ